VLASPRLRHRLALLGGAWFAAGTAYYALLLLAGERQLPLLMQGGWPRGAGCCRPAGIKAKHVLRCTLPAADTCCTLPRCSTPADGISSGPAASDESVHVTLLTAFAYEVPGIAAAGLAAERAGRKATTLAAFVQGGLLTVGRARGLPPSGAALVQGGWPLIHGPARGWFAASA
jgi:hypothetical protein